MSFALISVHDKDGLEPLVRVIIEMGYKILSTGGTADYLRKLGFKITDVKTYTNSPEALGGRVKTLHPKIYAGILFKRDDKDHIQEIENMGVEAIDIVIVNLYPFKDTVAKPLCTLAQAIEDIDIGGVTLIRAAAKNFQNVAILINPSQYGEFTKRLKEGRFEIEYKRSLASEAYNLTNLYDRAISFYLDITRNDQMGVPSELKPTLILPMRYGENPHQHAGLYSLGLNERPIVQLHGKELSYNNILDTDAALQTLLEFDGNAVVIVKHLTPCGVAIGSTIKEAYEHALESDPVSAYGGIVALNGSVDEETANEISKQFTEIVLAQSFTSDALKILMKKKNLRLLTFKPDHSKTPMLLRTTLFGTLIQEPDYSLIQEMKIVGTANICETDMTELAFAMSVVKHVKSNGISITKDFKTVGIGAGQPNRVGSVKIALDQADKKAYGAYLASDGYFPFPDSIELASKYGIKAIIEPGGSVKDSEIIEIANKLGIGLVFTGQRHFLH